MAPRHRWCWYSHAEPNSGRYCCLFGEILALFKPDRSVPPPEQLKSCGKGFICWNQDVRFLFKLRRRRDVPELISRWSTAGAKNSTTAKLTALLARQTAPRSVS